MPISEIIKTINKFIPKELSQTSWDKNLYRAHINEDYELAVKFNKNSISFIKLEHEVDFGNWSKPSKYDFVYEKYDRTYRIDDLDKSKDFERLKQKYLKPFDENKLKKSKIGQDFSAQVGDKNSLYISQVLFSTLDIECKK